MADVGGSLSSCQSEGLVHAVETLEMPLEREPDLGSSPSSHQSEGPVHALYT